MNRRRFIAAVGAAGMTSCASLEMRTRPSDSETLRYLADKYREYGVEPPPEILSTTPLAPAEIDELADEHFNAIARLGPRDWRILLFAGVREGVANFDVIQKRIGSDPAGSLMGGIEAASIMLSGANWVVLSHGMLGILDRSRPEIIARTDEAPPDWLMSQEPLKERMHYPYIGTLAGKWHLFQRPIPLEREVLIGKAVGPSIASTDRLYRELVSASNEIHRKTMAGDYNHIFTRRPS